MRGRATVPVAGQVCLASIGLRGWSAHVLALAMGVAAWRRKVGKHTVKQAFPELEEI
jgi:hypothetical protein